MRSFRERVSYLDGSSFIFMYDGIPIDLSDDEQTEIARKVRKFMENKEIHSDVIKNVSFIRTIFIDYDEQYLYIKYHDRTKDEYVEYKNKQLTLYNCKELETNNKKKNRTSSNSTRNETLNALKSIGPVGIGEDEYRLIDCFNYFYNMHPNFSNRQINIYFQCMVNILKEYGMELISNDDYILDPELGINVSPSLSKKITDLFPYGIIKRINNDNYLQEEEIEKIKEIGNNLSDTIHGVDKVKELLKYTQELKVDKKKKVFIKE